MNIVYSLFCQKKLSGEKLPPTFDSLILHLERVNCQCFIWIKANEPMHHLPSPIGNGWAGLRMRNITSYLCTTFWKLLSQYCVEFYHISGSFCETSLFNNGFSVESY